MSGVNQLDEFLMAMTKLVRRITKLLDLMIEQEKDK